MREDSGKPPAHLDYPVKLFLSSSDKSVRLSSSSWNQINVTSKHCEQSLKQQFIRVSYVRMPGSHSLHTHIEVKQPLASFHKLDNRKGKLSLNKQVLCDVEWSCDMGVFGWRVELLQSLHRAYGWGASLNQDSVLYQRPRQQCGCSLRHHFPGTPLTLHNLNCAWHGLNKAQETFLKYCCPCQHDSITQLLEIYFYMACYSSKSSHSKIGGLWPRRNAHGQWQYSGRLWHVDHAHLVLETYYMYRKYSPHHHHTRLYH